MVNNGGAIGGKNLMRRIRDVFYINANFNENYFMYYGMEFKEFIKHNPMNIENILITEGNYIANNFNKVPFRGLCHQSGKPYLPLANKYLTFF